MLVCRTSVSHRTEEQVGTMIVEWNTLEAGRLRGKEANLINLGSTIGISSLFCPAAIVQNCFLHVHTQV